MTKEKIFCAFLLFGQSFLLFGQQKIGFKTGKIPLILNTQTHLFLAGNFNNWNPADTAWELKKDTAGSYQLFKNIMAGSYNFKITRGSWNSVECSINGAPIENRTLSVNADSSIVLDIAAWQDGFKSAEKVHTNGPNVFIVSENFNIPQLGRERRIWVYLPANYKISGKKYPVIYMQDGQNLFDNFTAAYGEWGVDKMLDKLQPNEACIVVGIDHGGDNRITEYDPYDSKYGKGRGDDYADFLAKTLKPYIDQHYYTKPSPEFTTIAGSSMGGLISMYTVLKYPEVFANAGIFSPSFWIAPEIYTYAEKLKIPKKSRFYFVCGDAESKTEVAEMQKMADIIHTKGFNNNNASVTVIKDAVHNEKQWTADFLPFYKWLMRK